MRGHTRPLLVVDHDHDCCPGAKSCGQCIRGLLCQYCNAALGMIANDPTTGRALADYLERSQAAADIRAMLPPKPAPEPTYEQEKPA